MFQAPCTTNSFFAFVHKWTMQAASVYFSKKVYNCEVCIIERRIRRTKSLLRYGLAELLQTKPIDEITVTELVERSDINRSTFYLHYADIYDLLESIETELFDEVEHAAHQHLSSPFNESGMPFFEDVFNILFANREICVALIGPNGSVAFLRRIEEMISSYSMKALQASFPARKDDMKYTFSFCAIGCFGLIKDWLLGGCAESPQHMTALTFQMIRNLLYGSYPEN